MEGPLASEEALAGFLRAFEDGSLPQAEWKHAAHLTMAACYLLDHGIPAATARIRQGILHLNTFHGVESTDHEGYHESITIFWVRIAAAYLAQCPPGATRLERVRGLVENYARRRDLFREYYSFDLVKSVEARRGWVAPDVKPLP